MSTDDDPVFLRSEPPLWASPRFSLAVEHYQTVDGPVARPVVHHPGAVAVFACPRPGTVLLVRQYRYPLRRWTWEIPAGTCGPGEDPLATAQRELREEAGYSAAGWREWFAFYPSMGLSDELLRVYLAWDLSPAAMDPDHGELIAPRICDQAELRRLIASGASIDAKTLLAVARLPGMADCYAEAPPC